MDINNSDSFVVIFPPQQIVEVLISEILVDLIGDELHQMTVVVRPTHVLLLWTVLPTHVLVLRVPDLQTQEIHVVLIQVQDVSVPEALRKDSVEPHLNGTRLGHPLHPPPAPQHHQSPRHKPTLMQVTWLLKNKKRSVIMMLQLREFFTMFERFSFLVSRLL